MTPSLDTEIKLAKETLPKYDHQKVGSTDADSGASHEFWKRTTSDERVQNPAFPGPSLISPITRPWPVAPPKNTLDFGKYLQDLNFDSTTSNDSMREKRRRDLIPPGESELKESKLPWVFSHSEDRREWLASQSLEGTKFGATSSFMNPARYTCIAAINLLVVIILIVTLSLFSLRKKRSKPNRTTYRSSV